jgi:transposase-like protein
VRGYRRAREGVPGPADRGRLALLSIYATYVKVRSNGRVVPVAMIMAVGVNAMAGASN